jgi:hypothetical protein
MTDAEYHQQQLERQEWEGEVSMNHARFIGAARFIRDNSRGERDIQDAIKYMVQLLEDYEKLTRRFA